MTFKRIIASLALVVSVSGLVTVTTPTVVSAVCPNQTFLTFPMWHRNLDLDDNCAVKLNPGVSLNVIWVVVLNIIEMIIQAFAYLALGYILWNALKYVRSQGNSSQVGAAKEGILQASIGLFIALASVAIVRYIQGLVV